MQIAHMPFEQFAAEHGDYVASPIGFLFKNGSFSNGGSYHQLPPIDDRELTRRKKNFLQYKIESTQRELNQLSRYIDIQSQFESLRCGPPIHQSCYSAQVRLRAELNQLRAEIQDIHNGNSVRRNYYSVLRNGKENSNDQN